MRHGTENVLNGFDGLMDEHLSGVMVVIVLLVVVVFQSLEVGSFDGSGLFAFG